MFTLINLSVYLSTAWLVFGILKKIKIPNPSLMGGIISGAILSINGYQPMSWLNFSFVISNSIIGIIIGKQINRDIFHKLRSILFVIIVFSSGMLLLSTMAGYLVYLSSNIPLASALIASATGGTVEMISLALSMSLDEDIAAIVFFQMARVIFFLSIMPLISILSNKNTTINQINNKNKTNVAFVSTSKFNKKDYFYVFSFSFIIAYIFAKFDLYFGILLASMFISGIYVVYSNKSFKTSLFLSNIVQIFIGINIGQKITKDMIIMLPSLFLPTVLMIVVMLILTLFMAYILYKHKKWDISTCLLCASPVGLSQIVFFAEELNVNVVTASIFHTCRVICILLLYPLIIDFLIN